MMQRETCDGSSKGYFDGRTIVLDRPLDPGPPRRVLVRLEPLNDESSVTSGPIPQRGVPGSRLVGFAGSIAAEDLTAMRDAIRQGCEQVDGDAW
jgi:hypothetical protein